MPASFHGTKLHSILLDKCFYGNRVFIIMSIIMFLNFLTSNRTEEYSLMLFLYYRSHSFFDIVYII